MAITLLLSVSSCRWQPNSSSSEVASKNELQSSQPSSEAASKNEKEDYEIALFFYNHVSSNPPLMMLKDGAFKAVEDLKKQNINVKLVDYETSVYGSHIDLYEEANSYKPDAIIETEYSLSESVKKESIKSKEIGIALTSINIFRDERYETDELIDVFFKYEFSDIELATGEKMLELLKLQGTSSGKIAILGPLLQRTFRSVFEGTDYEVLDSLYVEGGPIQYKEALEKIIAENGNIVGVFCTYPDPCEGAAMAIYEAGLKDSVVLIGHQVNKKRYLTEGFADAYIYVDFYEMGYKSLMETVKFLNGETTAGKTVHVPPRILTKENAEQFYTEWEKYELFNDQG